MTSLLVTHLLQRATQSVIVVYMVAIYRYYSYTCMHKCTYVNWRAYLDRGDCLAEAVIHLYYDNSCNYITEQYVWWAFVPSYMPTYDILEEGLLAKPENLSRFISVE